MRAGDRKTGELHINYFDPQVNINRVIYLPLYNNGYASIKSILKLTGKHVDPATFKIYAVEGSRA